MSITHSDRPVALKRPGRRIGYGLAVGINLGLLFVVLNIVRWDILPWLTDDFSLVAPWIGFALVATIGANLVYLAEDWPPIKSTGQIATNLTSLLATAQVLLVFPFDFSAYRFDWVLVTRAVLVLALAGAGIGIIAETVKLATYGQERKEGEHGDGI